MQFDAIKARIDRVACRFAEIGHHLLDIIELHCARSRRRRLAELIRIAGAIHRDR